MNELSKKALTSKKDIYISNASARFGFTKQRIQQLLSEKFNSFSLKDLKKYDEFLESERQNIVDRYKNESKKPIETQYGVCPICGEKIYDAIDLSFQRNGTIVSGFICSKGGKGHYYKARTNQLMRDLGRNLIFKEYSEDARFPGL